MKYGTVSRKNSEGISIEEVEIKNFIQGFYPDGKKISVVELVDESMVLVVENMPESGKTPLQTLSLTRESYEGLMAFAMMHDMATGSRLAKNADAQDGVEYQHSDNIKI